MDVPRAPTTRPNALCDPPALAGAGAGGILRRCLCGCTSRMQQRCSAGHPLPIAARLQMLCSRFQVAVAPCIQSRKLRRTDVPHPHLAVPAAAALLSKASVRSAKRSVRFGHGESFGKIPTPAFAWLWAPPLVVVASCPCGSSGQNLPVQRASDYAVPPAGGAMMPADIAASRRLAWSFSSCAWPRR